ncbi:MAG: DUF2254 family protein [Lysobacteraceae bacterium]
MPNFRGLPRRARAKYTLHLHKTKIRLRRLGRRNRTTFAIVALLALVLSSVTSIPFMKMVAGEYFYNEANLETLRALLSSTGSALIGAAAIAFSLVVFAMQINVERMPHGLFKQLSSDKRLLGSFLGSFLSALLVAGTSLIPNGNWAIPAILVAIWAVVAIVLLFLYAFRRALQLINPIEQLTILSKTIRQDLQDWCRLADSAAILLDQAPNTETVSDNDEIQLNVAKAQFFEVNSHWTKPAEKAIGYIVSYAKRFAEQGDLEVTEYAFNCVMRINVTYCVAKRGTFVQSNPFFEVPNSTDSFINLSLEQLRQTMQAALSKGDEQLAECVLRAIAALCGVYLKIEYPGHDSSKHHSSLASGYLGSAVESVVPHDMPDLMMQGIRLMGRVADLTLDHTRPTEIVGIVQKIALLSSVGVVKANHQPVTLVAVEQLADITFDLLSKGRHDLRFAIRQLRSATADVAKRFLETSDRSLASLHSRTLGPYFSSTSLTSLRARLVQLVNQILEQPAESERAREIIANIETWADQIFVPQKELLLLAVQKRSHFTFDVIGWAIGISELLNALSNAPACSDTQRSELRKHSVWLVSTLSWLPDDFETVTFVDSYSFSERVFEAASDGLRRGCREFYESCKNLLIRWAKVGGRREAGWGILETSVKALVALALSETSSNAWEALQAKLQEMLRADDGPSAEARERAAAELTRSGSYLQGYGGHDSIDRALAQLDQASVRSRLLEMAALISTEPPAPEPQSDDELE